MDAIFLYIKLEYHQTRQGRHIPRGPGAAGFTLEWRGGERRSIVEGKPMYTTRWGWSLLGTQEFSLLAGVDSGVHVIWVVPRLVPTRLVGGFRHDRLITLAGHQCAAKNKKKQDWEGYGDCLFEGRWVIPARSCFPSQQQTKTGFKPFLNIHLIVRRDHFIHPNFAKAWKRYLILWLYKELDYNCRRNGEKTMTGFTHFSCGAILTAGHLCLHWSCPGKNNVEKLPESIREVSAP